MVRLAEISEGCGGLFAYSRELENSENSTRSSGSGLFLNVAPTGHVA